MVRQRRTAKRRSGISMPKHLFADRRLQFSSLGWATIVYFVVISVFGGAEVLFDLRGVTLALSAVIFSLFAMQLGALENWRRLPWSLRAVLVLSIAYPLVQIFPLPPSLWHHLPGQEVRTAVLNMAGLATAWQPISLTPVTSIYSAIAMIGFVMALLAVITVSDREFHAIIIVVLVFVAIGLLIGVVQISSGGNYPRFFASADYTAMIGLYANKNHMGLAMASSIPLAYYRARQSKRWASSRQMIFYGYWLLIMLALPLTNSRAGVVFGLTASAAVAWTSLNRLSWKVKSAAAAVFAILVATLAVSPMPQALLGRFAAVSQDNRWEIFLHSATLVTPYGIFGSGLGSFREVFQTFENLEWIGPRYVNNAHNDYLQILIEMGMVGPIIVIGMLWCVGRAMMTASASRNSLYKQAAWVGFIVVALFAMHSVVDYPLRRPASVAIFIAALSAILRIYRNQSVAASTKPGLSPG